MGDLYRELVKYSTSNFYPMHMPGHKRRYDSKNDLTNKISAFQIDITEIDGFDNLHDATGILKNSQENARNIYNSAHTYFLINGSTAGILAAISASTNKSGKVLMARNCHKSVYNGIYLNNLTPIYLYPEQIPEYEISGGIDPADVEDALSTHTDIQLVVITSPTYEGIVSDISSIATITKRYSVPLLVDEAHGAHFGFNELFPINSLVNGADIVIHSLHKTLPSLTQTALLHVNYSVSEKINNEIKRYLSIYQTSSPSYVLMSSIDLCLDTITNKGAKLFNDFTMQLTKFTNEIKTLQAIKMLNSSIIGQYQVYDFDISKLVFFIANNTLSGVDLYNILLKRYSIQMETTSLNYVLGISTIYDTEEGFERLLNALIQTDNIINQAPSKSLNNNYISYNNSPKMLMTPSQSYEKENVDINFSESEGKISAEYVYLYPPGIPMLVPGEVINIEVINYIQSCVINGLTVKGLTGKNLEKISVILC